jgi:uncharacterized protein YceK
MSGSDWNSNEFSSGELMRRHFLTVVLLALLAGCATVDDGPAGHSQASKKMYGGQIYGHCQ